MIKKIIYSICILVLLGIIASLNTSVHSSSSGAPAGYTGSPADGKTCGTNGGCHADGDVPAEIGWIISNVPLNKYTPGATYSFTATASQAGISKFGFQISPQAANGTYLGTLIATNTAETQIVSTKYLTHKTAGTSGTDSKSWTFDWTAPVAGTGTVTFYGAFNAANGNGNNSGDQIHTSTLILSEDTASGVALVNTLTEEVLVYPNPVADRIIVRAPMNNNSSMTIELLDLNGRKLETLMEKRQGVTEESFILKNKYAAGTYFISVESGNKKMLKKILILDNI